jgi:hypothetical protein
MKEKEKKQKDLVIDMVTELKKKGYGVLVIATGKEDTIVSFMSDKTSQVAEMMTYLDIIRKQLERMVTDKLANQNEGLKIEEEGSYIG